VSQAVTDGKNQRTSRGASFTSQNKLRKPAEFKRVFKKPFVSSDACFKVLARLGEGENSRLGMAVSRQVDKRAVGRNRIKRVVRESFRQRYTPGKKPLDIVVLPKRETATICNKRLEQSLQGHWLRLDNQFEG
jgi:ribonuclease P protein component